MNIQEIRQKYPQYKDLSDQQVAVGLHKKYYSDMDFGTFSQKIGLQTQQPAQQQKIDPTGHNPQFSDEPDYSGLPVGEPSYGGRALMGGLNVIDYPRQAILGSNVTTLAENPYADIEGKGMSLGGMLAKPMEKLIERGGATEALPQDIAKEEKFELAPKIAEIGVDLATQFPYYFGGMKLLKGVKREAQIINAHRLIGKAEGAIDKTINKNFKKGIKPYFSGKKTWPQINKYYDNAKNAVKSIVKYSKDELPQTVEEFSKAVYDTKIKIYNRYSALSREAGDAGVMVDLQPVINDMKKLSKSDVLARTDNNFATALQKEIGIWENKPRYVTPQEAEELAASKNAMGQLFWNDPNPNNYRKALSDARIGNLLGKQIEKSLPSGKKYTQLRKEYGSLKEIERDVARRSIVWNRRNVKGFYDLADIYTSGEFIRGLIKMDPSNMVSAMGMHLAKRYIKSKNDVDKMVRNMFEDVSNITTKQKELKSIIPKEPKSPPKSSLKRIGWDGTLTRYGSGETIVLGPEEKIPPALLKPSKEYTKSPLPAKLKPNIAEHTPGQIVDWGLRGEKQKRIDALVKFNRERIKAGLPRVSLEKVEKAVESKARSARIKINKFRESKGLKAFIGKDGRVKVGGYINE